MSDKPIMLFGEGGNDKPLWPEGYLENDDETVGIVDFLNAIQVPEFKEATETIVIDSEENDDWMKSLPGYQDEAKIHEDLAKKHSKGKPKFRLKK